MSKNIALTPVSPALCGLAQAAELLGDRWTLLILREVFYGVTRFEQMREHIGATKQTLTTRLAKMVEQDLLAKRSYQESGMRERYEYVLTDKSRSLGPVLAALMVWGHQHILHDAPHLQLTEKHSGQPVQPGFVTAEGKSVAQDDLILTPLRR